MPENVEKFQGPDRQNLVESYYDRFSDWYEAVWSNQIHTGMFEGEDNLDQAVARTNSYLAEFAGIKPGNTVLTVGCGRGAADRFLAAERRAKVTGIDLSNAQLKAAAQRAAEAGVQDQIVYQKASMTELPFAADSYDFIWAQESFFYCTNKAKAAAEFQRVLKTGGKVIIEDTVLQNAQARDEVYQRFNIRAGVEELLTPEQYIDLFSNNGFELVAAEDWTDNLARTYQAIVQNVRKNKAQILKKLPELFNYTAAAENDFAFPDSLQLAQQRKLGCRVMLFQKK